MIAEFITNHVFMSSILLFGIFSVFMQWMMTISLKSYVKASANMKTTKKKVMINLKNQFETIYGMDNQIRNTSVYVDKYLLKLRFLGFSFAFWEKVPFLSAGIVTLIAGGTAFYTYNTTAEQGVLIEILFSYGLVLACFFMFFHIFGIKSKKQQIQIQLVDYLENYLTNRVTRSRDSLREVSKEPEEDMQMLLGLVKEMEHTPPEKEIAVSEENSLKSDVQEKETTINRAEIKDKSDAELLEEFVQSFLA